jgi:hypothetical protein
LNQWLAHPVNKSNLKGVVRDAAGAAVAGALVKLQNTAPERCARKPLTPTAYTGSARWTTESTFPRQMRGQ